MPSAIINSCARAMAEKNLTIAFAESATAGRLASEFSLTPDSGKVLKGGLVCYDAEVKESILGVEKSLIEKFTPESAEVTEDLARRLRKFMPSGVSVAITGLTTPGGSETKDKPVGTMFIFVLIREKPLQERQAFSGSPEQIILQAIDRVAAMILEELEKA
jgi:nicotinamide-nucleotide amidase